MEHLTESVDCAGYQMKRVILASRHFHHNQMKLLDRLGVAFSQNGYLQQGSFGLDIQPKWLFVLGVKRGVQICPLGISARSNLVPCFIWGHASN